MKQQCVAEGLGTFFLVLAGTASIIVNDVSGGAISHLGIAACFGLVVMAVIYAIGDVSGAHINPAVTLGFWISKRFPGKKVLPFILSQCLGGFSASLLLFYLFPNHPTLGATLPKAPLMTVFVFEVLLTWLLMFVILHVATGAKEKGIMAGMAIGGTVGLCALFGGPITGASMNPIRSLAPALVSGSLDQIWIYIAAPLLGVYFAHLGCKLIQKEGCCQMEPSQDD